MTPALTSVRKQMVLLRRFAWMDDDHEQRLELTREAVWILKARGADVARFESALANTPQGGEEG